MRPQARTKLSSDLSALSDAELEKLLADGLSETKDLVGRAKFLHWAPLPHQREWLTDDHQIRLLLAGNQTGKSTCAIVWLLSQCLGTLPVSLGGSGVVEAGSLEGHRYLLGAETFESSIRQNILGKFDDFGVSHFLAKRPKKNSLGIESEFEFITGAKLNLASYTSDPKTFEGSVLHGVMLDEPPPREIFNAIRRGTMAKQAKMFIAATPIGASAGWMLDDLILPAQDPDSPSFKAIKFFSASIWDNSTENGGVLAPDQIESFLSTLPESERDSREKGTFSNLQGIEFGYVTAETHVVPDFERPAGWPLIEVCDPAAARGLCVLWATVSPDEDIYVIEQAYIPNEGFDAMVGELRRYRRSLGREPDLAILDVRGGNQLANQITKATWFDLFRDRGVSYQPTEQSHVGQLHDEVKLKWDPATPDADARPRLRMTQSVSELKKGPLWAMSRFMWSSKPTKRMREQPAKDVVDCLRYLAGYPRRSFAELTRRQSGADQPGIAATYRPTSQASPLRRRSAGPTSLQHRHRMPSGY